MAGLDRIDILPLHTTLIPSSKKFTLQGQESVANVLPVGQVKQV